MRITVLAEASHAHVQQRILTAASAYKCVWERIKHDIRAPGRGGEAGQFLDAFFDIDYYEPDGEWTPPVRHTNRRLCVQSC
jgi:hypothetical protein